MKNNSKVNALIAFGAFVISGITGFFAGQITREEKITEVQEELKKASIIIPEQRKPIDSRTISSVVTALPMPPNQRVEHENFLKKFLEEKENQELFKKSQKFFQNSKNRDAFALWVTLGNSLTSSPQYGQLFESSLAKINENPDGALGEISDKIRNLGREDDFLRGMLNNLVANLNVDDAKKFEFFGKELNRSVGLDSKGGLDEGSSSFLNSLIFLKKYGTDENEVKNVLEESLDKNKIISDALKYRFLQYFPNLKNEDL
jgi:hypothetical protein